MKRFGLIGNPVAGSLSPLLFAAAYGGRHAYDLIEGAVFDVSWQRFLDGYDGINVTAPFKLDAFQSVDILSESARLCGAVNLAVKTPDGVAGYNTDVDGVKLAVQEAGMPVSEALVIGCGGAGRAAAVAALQLGCRVTVANRTPVRASALAGDLACRWMPVDALGSLSPDLVIYTVPGPMEGLPAFPEAVILEANYRTPVLEGHGRAYIPGRRWLLYQAVAGYSIFTGEAPDTGAMLRIFC
jgi:shikimate 5-dehydrogenase